MKYQDFLKSKRIKFESTGFEVDPKDINSKLFDFQRDIVVHALKKGRFGIFADTGLGKTFMQLEWAKHISLRTTKPALIFAPLAVSKQTKREGEKINIDVNICESQDDVTIGANITNYEKLHRFDLSEFSGIVLDESSILKSFSGKFRTEIIEKTRFIKYKLACTATPSPNDFMELGNHSEFLGAMTRAEMLSTFFIHDSGDTAKWRLMKHAEESKFWEFLAQWSVFIQKPSDLGYEDDGFILPGIEFHEIIVEDDAPLNGTLFNMEARTLNERRRARKQTITQRTDEVMFKIYEDKSIKPWLIWCNLNDESKTISEKIDFAVEVTGSQKEEVKEDAMLKFAAGEIDCMVTKPKICGFGMNYQVCSNIMFLGLSDSYEQFYQAVRRCYRFGQKKKVNVYIVISEKETSVLKNIKRKQKDVEKMMGNMVEHTKKLSTAFIHEHKKESSSNGYYTRLEESEDFKLFLGDTNELIKDINTESIDYSVFSPPFAELYTYSNSERDMGNARNYDEFFEHFAYLTPDLFRIIKQGRLLTVHCVDIPAMKERDGYIGLKDFPGDLIRAFQNVGFIFHSRHTIWKDPLIEATRTKSLGLMHKQIVKDSSKSRAGIPDQLLTFRKPGENSEPIAHPNGFERFIGDEKFKPKAHGIKNSHLTWQKYASPVWMDIDQSRTLNKTEARAENDEKHICPLQLDVIERCLELWSNPGDLIYDPFGGIQSTGYVALQNDRKYIGMELKESYFNEGLKNLRNAKQSKLQTSIFDEVE